MCARAFKAVKGMDAGVDVCSACVPLATQAGRQQQQPPEQLQQQRREEQQEQQEVEAVAMAEGHSQAAPEAAMNEDQHAVVGTRCLLLLGSRCLLSCCISACMHICALPSVLKEDCWRRMARQRIWVEAPWPCARVPSVPVGCV